MSIRHETVISLVDAATSKKVHTSTVFRWHLKGINGHRLETFLLGGRRCTSEEAIDRFLDKINEATADAAHEECAREALTSR